MQVNISSVISRAITQTTVQVLRKPVVGYTVLVAFVTLILFWRYPNNVIHPNFYAEDGSVFLQNVLNEGWLKATFHSFNGYFVVGLYVIEAIGWALNLLFGHQGLLSLPQFFALASILCMAAVIALPYLLFKRTYGYFICVTMVLFGALLPLPQSPHIVIGTVGNQKWVFMYLAFLITWYWLHHYRTISLRRTIPLFLALLLCAYTNTTTYLLVPVLFTPYAIEAYKTYKKGKLSRFIKQLIGDKLFIALVTLCILLVPQVIYVYLHGIPKLPGYLDTVYDPSKTIEIFANRTYLFGITHLFNKYLSDVLALIILVAFIGFSYYSFKRRERATLLLSLYAAGVASFLFVLNRTGVSAFFTGYARNGSGPDQFFYAQTLIMYPIITLALFSIRDRLPWRRIGQMLSITAVLFIVGSGLISNALFGAIWRNANTYDVNAGTFIDNTLAACKLQSGQAIRVTVYPFASGQYSLSVPREDICTDKLRNYQATTTQLHLEPTNSPLTVTQPRTVYQTFVAPEGQLNGIRLLLSNYANERRSGTYDFELYDANCSTKLRSVAIPTVLLDNSFYDIRFAAIKDSKQQKYCFTITPPQGHYDPLAIQLSAPGLYLDGDLRTGTTISPRDVIFAPLFNQNAAI